MPNTLLDDSFAQSTNSAPDGDGPSWVALTPDGRYALVTHHTTSNVAVIDLDLMMTIAMIPTPAFPEHIAITPDGQYALTADEYNHTVSIIDLNSWTLLTSIPTNGSYPYRVAISADSQTAVVGCINDASVSAFTVIDIPSRTALRTFSSTSQGVVSTIFTFETGQSNSLYSQFALTPDGAKVISLDRVNSRVMIYRTSDGAQLASLNCPDYPTAIKINAQGTRAAITHESNTNQISVVNIAAQTLASFPTGFLISGTVAITDDGAEAITVQSPSNIVFTDLSNGMPLGNIAISGTPSDLVLYAGGTRLFASGLNAAILNVTNHSLVLTMGQGDGYQAAVASNAPIGVSLNNRYREEVLVYSLDPAGSYGMGIVPSGMPPESDSPRRIALSPDGHTVVAANDMSGNVCIWDLDWPDALTLTDVGLRPVDIAFRPDGKQAAVVAADSDMVTFLNLTPGISLGSPTAQITVPARPVSIVYSPDGTRAFVLCIDARQVVSINTTNGAIINTAAAGTVRASYSISYVQFPSMAISPDGNVLAICEAGGSPARLRLHSTSNLALLGTAPTGSWPLSVVFSPDSSRAYVSSFSTDTVAVIRVTGGPIAKLAAVPTLAGPLTLTLDRAGRYLYTGCFNPAEPGLSVIDTTSNTSVLDLALDGYCPRASALNPACSQLYLATTGDYDDRLYRLHADGPSTTILDQQPLSWSPSDLAVSSRRNTAFVAQPVFDTIDILTYEVPVDLDLDGAVDLTDFFLFLNAFDSSLIAADINYDGEVDLNDFFEFLNGFDVGCT